MTEDPTPAPQEAALIGQVFSRLTVMGRAKNNYSGRRRWLCKCECGVEKEFDEVAFRYNGTKSCGCLRNEMRIKHGHRFSSRSTAEYSSWCNMHLRVKDSKNPGFKNYGGRGIKICQRWEKFENFLEDMGPRPTAKHSIDRVDNNKDYCPENCRWATRSEQNRNTRQNHYLSYGGETKCLADWCNSLGLSKSAVGQRLRRGCSLEEALNPLKKEARGKTPASGVKGVGFNRRLQKWYASIYLGNHEKKHLGYFLNKEDAAEAVRHAKENTLHINQ